MLARLAQCSVLALALANATQANAGATIYGTYYDETATGFCTNIGGCRVQFSQLPSDKLLMVSKVSCEIVTSTGVPIVQLGLFIAATSNGLPVSSRKLQLTFPPTLSTSSGSFATTREDTHYLIGQGRFPYVFVNLAASASTIQMNCTIIGDLVTPIQ